MSEEELITLDQACESFFAGKIKVATLRAEASRGKLTLFRIGRRDFTTVKNLKEMVNRCRVHREGLISTLIRNEELGRSEMDRISSAHDAAKASVERLKGYSRDISRLNTARNPQSTRS